VEFTEMPPEQFSTSKNVIDAIAAKLRSAHRPFAGAQLRVAVFRSSVGARFLTGTAFFAEDRLNAREVADYQNLQLIETWISNQDAALDSISRLLLGQGSLRDYQISDSFGHSTLNHDAAGELASGWPSWVFTSSADYKGEGKRLYVPPEPTINKGLEPFSSPGDAIRSWIFNSRRSSNPMDEIPNQDRFLTIVPDTRACFRSGKWVPGQLTLQVLLNIASADLELQIIHVGASQRSAIHPVEDGTMTIDVPEDAQQLILHLVHQSGDLIYHKALHAGYRSFGDSEPDSEKDDFANDLSKGENEDREFKPFIAPKNEKEAELVKAVVAFANTAGGRLFVGVNDEGVPLGLPAVQKLFRQQVDPIEAQLARVKKLIMESIKPVPDVSYRVAMVHGNPLILVEVGKLSRICSTQDNRIYIRKGATNRLADPLTEIPSMLVPQDWVEGKGY
jgi:hypothetical protein